jgi:hypothetical protein
MPTHIRQVVTEAVGGDGGFTECLPCNTRQRIFSKIKNNLAGHIIALARLFASLLLAPALEFAPSLVAPTLKAVSALVIFIAHVRHRHRDAGRRTSRDATGRAAAAASSPRRRWWPQTHRRGGPTMLPLVDRPVPPAPTGTARPGHDTNTRGREHGRRES